MRINLKNKLKVTSKKGELTTQQLVGLIILIVSFGVILFLIFRLNPGDVSEKEICHNSVVLRSKSVFPGAAGALDCHREYICITQDGSCEKMTKPIVKKVKEKEEVYEILAKELLDCWWMFGEGKINYVAKETFPELYCSVCDQILFDDSLKKNELFGGSEIDSKEFYQYLENNKVPGKEISYMAYLYRVGDLKEFEDYLRSEKNAVLGKINLDKQYYLIMGISSQADITKWTLIGTALGTVAAGFIATPIGAGVLLKFLASGVVIKTIGTGAGWFTGTIVDGASGNTYLAPTLIEVDSEDFKNLNCKSIVNLA